MIDFEKRKFKDFQVGDKVVPTIGNKRTELTISQTKGQIAWFEEIIDNASFENLELALPEKIKVLIGVYTERLTIMKNNRANEIDRWDDATTAKHQEMINQVAEFIQDLKFLIQ